MSIVPRVDARTHHAAVLDVARHYVEVMNWPIFVLGHDKTTLRNCDRCRVAGPEHDREACECLTCHGFYAATRDLARLSDALWIAPRGLLALRTGRASGVSVIDAEATADLVRDTVDDGAGGRLVTGLQVLDEWEQWVGEGRELGQTLRARTGGGGLHLFYSTESESSGRVKSRGRVLPGVDVKGDGGYVALPTPGHNRSWLVPEAGEVDRLDEREPTVPGAGLREWLLTARGTSTGGRNGGSGGAGGASGGSRGGDGGSGAGWTVDGYDFARALRDGARDGERDVFFRDLLFRLRIAGHSRESALAVARHHWLRCQQLADGARWEMPWHHVEGKLDHTWRTLQPDARVDWRAATAQRIAGRPDSQTEELTRRGRRTIHRRTE